MATDMTFAVEHFSEDEELIRTHSFEDFARHVVARATFEAEESDAAVSTRPTIAVFVSEPWR